jgi:hypothetical protein
MQDKCDSDDSRVDVFLYHTDTNSRAKTLVLPCGDVKISKPLKKMDVHHLPVTCLLAKYDGRSVQAWATSKGCTAKLWDEADYKCKGMQARAEKEQRQAQEQGEGIVQ